jgi:site-specific DNA-cytosine methylase
MSKIINIGQTGSSQNTRVIDSEGISYAVTNGEKDGVPKIVEPQFLEFSNFISLGAQNNSYNRVWKTEGYCGALNCTKQMEILEPQVMTPKRTDFGKAIRKQYEQGNIQMSRHDMTELEPRQDGISNTLTSVQKDNLVVEPRYRIRKLTPRECFRLMDVDDADIDKIQEAGISNSQQYKMAGNSIVVACLYHLFRKMFTETQNEERQLTFW